MNRKYMLVAVLPALILLQVFIPMIMDLFSAMLMIGIAGYVGYTWNKE